MAFPYRIVLCSFLLWYAPVSGQHAAVRTASPRMAVNAAPRTRLRQLLGDTPGEREFERSISPYLNAFGSTGAPLLKRLPLWAGAVRSAYSVGDDLVVMPTAPTSARVLVTLPDGHWVNFWTGAQALGGSTFVAEIPARNLAVWVRGGSVIQRHISASYRQEECAFQQPYDYPDDCRATYLLDVMPPYVSSRAVLTDSQGRSIRRSSTSLELQGKPARVTIRWRFTPVASVRVNGRPVMLQNSPAGYYATFDHTERSTVAWSLGGYMTASY